MKTIQRFRAWRQLRLIACEDVTTELPILSKEPSKVRLFFEKLGYPKRRYVKNWKP